MTMNPVMSPEKLQKLGLNHVAYIRPSADVAGAYALHAADGTLLQVLDGLNTALNLAHQNDLTPVTVH